MAPSYATDAVSRPKAHTGRTTGAPRKKASTAKTSTAKTSTAKPTAKTTATDPAAATEESAAKKTKAKAKPKSKPKSKRRTRAKSTKARKKSKKAKAKPAKKKKKVVTPEEKERIILKELKLNALKIPKMAPASAFSVLLAERAKEMKVAVGAGRSPATESSSMYRAFTPEEREHYNHIANQNKVANKSKYKEWILSHTPSQIYEANRARRSLKSRSKSGRSWPKLQDERSVLRQRNAYSGFVAQRYSSGDFAGLNIAESGRLIGAEWRAMSESDKEPFTKESERDSARYKQEVKAVYKRDVRPRKPSGQPKVVKAA
ncbi:MAG: hypothetical protein Q9186_002707 [Xanthomendoza sp. 1 TL-2023]